MLVLGVQKDAYFRNIGKPVFDFGDNLHLPYYDLGGDILPLKIRRLELWLFITALQWFGASLLHDEQHRNRIQITVDFPEQVHRSHMRD